MDFFWEITVVETLLNVAVFAVAVIGFGLVRLAFGQWLPQSAKFSDTAVGLLFGMATAVALLLPVHLNGGASTGSQTVLLSLAGLVTGPLAAAVALGVALAAQLIRHLENGTVDVFGVAMLLIASGSGVALRAYLRRKGSQTPVYYYHFPVLGALTAALGVCVLWLFQGVEAARGSAAAAMIAGTLVTSVLGTLMLHETRRHQAEEDLRKSEARLAAQAKELADARDSAEQANRAKSAFLANMSHELRTPLNAILGFSEIIALESFGSVGVPQYKEYGQDIHDSGVHLLSLINDLLDVAKIEAGKLEIAPEFLTAGDLFEDVRRLVGEKAAAKGLALTFQVLPDVPPLYADERALKQILINLISNAIKFTPKGGKILVTGEAAPDGGFRIVCADTGEGIPADKLDTIFKPFTQVDNRYNRQAGGTGLGLSLVKGLAELHGGRAWLESEYGKGCRACVALPPAPRKTSNQAA